MRSRFVIEENQELVEQFVRELRKLKGTDGVLMPALQLAQRTFGYLPKEIVLIISDELKKPLAEIYGVASFYSQYRLEPQGEYNVDVCTGTSCYAMGSEAVLKRTKEVIGLEPGETSADGHFSLSSSKCHGLCSQSPVMTVNDDIYLQVRVADVQGILEQYK